VKAALNGLDQEQPSANFFGPELKKAVEAGTVPASRLDDMVERILYSLFASGAIDDPPARRVVNPFLGEKDAQHIAEEGIVLLQNTNSILPLSKSGGSIAVIGSHADVGVLSGGGSAQVDSPGGNAINPSEGASPWGKPIYFPSAPLEFIRDKAPQSSTVYNSGDDVKAAAALAAKSDTVILFLHQWQSEGADSPTLSLPDDQDALVEAIAKANPHTIVVLENGGPVSMPWASHVAAILESWYPGIGGGEAIANILFGDVNPSGKLPATFAARDADLPYQHVPGLTENTKNNGMNAHTDAVAEQEQNPTVDYNIQGLKVGYKWFQTEHKTPLFAFGHGLSYTTFAYSALSVNHSTATLTLTNTGKVTGTDVAQLYATLPSASGEPFRRLVGWQRITLAPGESKVISITTDPTLLSIFDVSTDSWKRLPGQYLFEAGTASDDLTLHTTVTLP
jgi:beta-glucosidase